VRHRYCGGASWPLAPYGQRNCLLASTTDRRIQIAHREQVSFLHNASLGFPFLRCHAFPIEQLAIWHAFIPSTLPRNQIFGCDLESQPCQNYWQYSQTDLSCSWLVQGTEVRKTTDHPSRVRLELLIRCLFVSLVQAGLLLCDGVSVNLLISTASKCSFM
jgi:hypothetical protein